MLTELPLPLYAFASFLSAHTWLLEQELLLGQAEAELTKEQAEEFSMLEKHHGTLRGHLASRGLMPLDPTPAHAKEEQDSEERDRTDATGLSDEDLQRGRSSAFERASEHATAAVTTTANEAE